MAERTNAPGAMARATGRAVPSGPTDTRIVAPRPSRKARRGPSGGSLRNVLERATCGPFDPRISALLDLAIARDDWRVAVERFAEENGLGPQQRRELRVELLRRRVFGGGGAA